MSKKRKSLKRNLIEWGILIAVAAVLYFTGSYTEVIGDIQGVILWTHIIQPNDPLPADRQISANYFMRLTSLNGEPITLLKFRSKTIFMNFWASWCPPCRAEMPAIQSLFNDFKNKNVIFLMISVDRDQKKAANFIKEKNFTFPVYFANGNIPSEYNTNTIPATFVISPEGKIVFKEKGMSNYNTDKFKSMLTRLINSEVKN